MGKYTQDAVRALLPESGDLMPLDILASLGGMSESQMRRLLEALERKSIVYHKEDLGGQSWGLLTPELAASLNLVTPEMSEFKRRQFKRSSSNLESDLKSVGKKHKRDCHFCGVPVPVGSGGKYIFPVPPKYNLLYEEGAYGCADCAPKVEAEQVSLGLLQTV